MNGELIAGVDYARSGILDYDIDEGYYVVEVDNLAEARKFVYNEIPEGSEVMIPTESGEWETLDEAKDFVSDKDDYLSFVEKEARENGDSIVFQIAVKEPNGLPDWVVD